MKPSKKTFLYKYMAKNKFLKHILSFKYIDKTLWVFLASTIIKVYKSFMTNNLQHDNI